MVLGGIVHAGGKNGRASEPFGSIEAHAAQAANSVCTDATYPSTELVDLTASNTTWYFEGCSGACIRLLGCLLVLPVTGLPRPVLIT